MHFASLHFCTKPLHKKLPVTWALNAKSMDTLQTTNIKEFELSWRWTQESHTVIPENDLFLIQPLSLDSAIQVFESANKLLSSTKVESKGLTIQHIEFLKSNLTEEPIIISWGKETAVKTNTVIFIKYFDDFCYPSSDDITIYPTSKSWCLTYQHFEVLCFAKQ